MKHLKTYKLFEAKVDDMFLPKSYQKLVDTISDICQEFEDENCECEIKSVSEHPLGFFHKSRFYGHRLESDLPFYLKVDIDRRILPLDIKRSGDGKLPNWFIENCRRIEDYMDSEGYKVKVAIKYPTDLEYLDSMDELSEQVGLIYGVWFLFDEKVEALTESVDVEKEIVEDFLRDFSDDEDIPVEVEMYRPDPLGSEEERVLILIGDEDHLWLRVGPKDLPLYKNIDNFISINDYLLDEGYQLKSIACWIKPHNEPITGQRPITIFEFDKFINKIEEIENWNSRYPALWHKTFKLVDICYQKCFMNESELISGAEFKKKYLTTDSGKLEKAFFEYESGDEDMDTMGSVLGKGSYFSVTADSSAHYESDDYYAGSDYYELSNDAKILLVPDAQKYGGQKIRQMAKAKKADGVYDPTEGKTSPYLGLVIYNKNMIK